MITKLATLAVTTLLAADGKEDPAETVTWSGDIAPILQESCETCHRPGQVGPFALQTYEQAKGWAEMIASVVEEQRMPPWNATEDYRGVFANERALPKKDKQLILDWVEQGMPRGNPDEDPEPVEWPDGWRIGVPDQIFTVDEFRGERTFGKPQPLDEQGFLVPRDGVVEYQYFSVKTNFAEDKWIKALEVKPGAADVVHHVLILVDDPNGTPEERQRQLDFRSYFAGAAPGDLPITYPEDYGKRLPAGSTLIFQLHYTPNGKERFDRSSVGMIFWDETPLFEVVTNGIVNLRLDIPAGATNHEVRAEEVMTQDTGIVALSPHMHTRGKDFKFIAHYPDGGSEELLACNYDFNWQEVYVLPDPLFLPSGTRIECIGHYDNSADNPNNPDPSIAVRWGDQSFEEMFIGYYDYVIPVGE
jgi:hypothetical protein